MRTRVFLKTYAPAVQGSLPGGISRTILLALVGCILALAASDSPIHFAYRHLAFRLENGETPRKYAPETMAGGVAVFDYDGDGRLDIYFANGAEMPDLRKSSPKYSNRLFRNTGEAQFADVTEKAGVSGSGYDTGVVAGDYDGDGHCDLFVAGVHHYTLYHNNGDGTFTDVTARAGLAAHDADFGPLWGVGGAWLDYNGDGRLDLFVVNYLQWNPKIEPSCTDYCHPKYYTGLPNRLYRNNGDGTFSDVSAESGIRDHIGKGMGVATADFDSDGMPDLFVTNDKLYNSFFHNKGNGKFEEIAFDAGVALAAHGMDISGMGTDARDIDNDGHPDIVFVALENETFPFFRNTGKGVFEDRTAQSELGRLASKMAGYSPGIYDFDNDGWKDLFVSRGHVQSVPLKGTWQIEQNNSVFRNLRNGKFEEAQAGFDARPPLRHRGAAFGDLNGDGLIDVVVTALNADVEIWMNQSSGGNHWIDVRLAGSGRNRDSVGAVVKVVTKNGAQYNHAGASVGYASSSFAPIHFGLGSDLVIDLIEVRWPSGNVQRLTSVKGDSVLTIKEP